MGSGANKIIEENFFVTRRRTVYRIVVPSAFLFDDRAMEKVVVLCVTSKPQTNAQANTQANSRVITSFLALALAGVLLFAGGVSAETFKQGKKPGPKKSKTAKALSYYFRVPHESATPHLMEECPTTFDSDPKLMKGCEAYVSGSEIKARRCLSLDEKFVYFLYKSKKDCLIDREATLANEE